MRKFRLPSGWTRYLAPVGIGIFTVALVIWMLFQQDAAMDRLASNYDALHQEYQSLYSEAVTGGVDPEAPAPDEVPAEAIDAPSLPIAEEEPDPGPSGPRGPGPTQDQVVSALASYCSVNNCKPTPTVAQVAAAISNYCADGQCRGEKGEKGDDAEPVTAEQIGAAVADYCAEGACQGANGQDGEDGRTPTEAEIRAYIQDEVATYCQENNNCQGDPGTPGATGDTGPAGKDGRGIETTTCPDDEDDDWVIHYTDGSSETVAGPCRAQPIIEPEPTPEATP